MHILDFTILFFYNENNKKTEYFQMRDMIIIYFFRFDIDNIFNEETMKKSMKTMKKIMIVNKIF